MLPIAIMAIGNTGPL